MTTKVLVTGGRGFLGRHLCEYLESHMQLGNETKPCYNVRTVSRSPVRQFTYLNENDAAAKFDHEELHYAADLSQETAVRRIFNHWTPDIIVHLAANPNGKPDMLAPTAILDDNIKATQNLLHWCPEGTRFIFSSSIVVYGDITSYVRDEKRHYIPPIESSNCNPTSLYGITKLASEHLIKAYYEYRNINYGILRLSAIVGPGLTHGILKDFIRKSKDNPTLEMLGDAPGAKKPFTHVSNVVVALEQLMQTKENLLFNFCPRKPISVDGVADIVLEELGLTKEKVWLGANANWKGDNPILIANSNAGFKWGLVCDTTSEEALRRAVKENV